MDRRRMDANGGRAVHRDMRGKKLAVVIALQNLLVAACLLVTLYVYWDVHRDAHEPTFEDNVHIQFVAIGDIEGNKTLQFGEIYSSNMMGLVDNNNDKIYSNCTGPYILYMDVCYKSLPNQETSGMLQLQVVGSKTPVSSVSLAASHEVCRGLHSIAYLKAKEEASLHLYCTEGFKIKNVTVGLSYLLGSQCDY